MFLARVLCLWLWALTLTSTPATTTLQVPPHLQSPLLSRLDRLEALLADHQAQWRKEKRDLTDKLHLLQGDVTALQKEKQEMRTQMEALRDTDRTAQAVMQSLQIQTRTLAADNQALKTELGEVHRQLVSMTRTQPSLQDRVSMTRTQPSLQDTTRTQPSLQDMVSMTRTQPSLQDIVTQWGTAPRPDQEGDGKRGDGEEDKSPTQHKKESSAPQHVRTARSDDQGPLEVVTSHLAQQVTLISADVQALKTQHTDDVQALKTQHTDDVQALKTQHTDDVQALKTQHTDDVQALNTQHTDDVQALKTSDAQQHRDIQAARGSTFVQWGSSTCAGSSELVYSGVVGGSYYSHRGAAANALCLTLSPTLWNWPSHVNDYSLLYGGEYETYDSHNNKDPVCAVCRSSQPTTIMVPGTNVCSAGWTLQYRGYLMAGYYDYAAASQFICVDSKLESRMDSSANQNGYLLHYTKTQCGSLPCTPYENNKRVTCAVCSK